LSQQPVPGTHPAFAKTGAGRSVVPYLALHPMGFSVPPRLRLERWALTPPFHPYPALSEIVSRTSRPDELLSVEWRAHFGFRKSGAVCFLWHCPSGPERIRSTSRVYPAARLSHRGRSGGSRLRGIAPSGVRTFLPPENLRGSDPPPFQNQE